jgi:hypothetical protein
MELGKPRLAQSPLSTPIDEAERLILANEGQPTRSEQANEGEVAVPANVEQVENSTESELLANRVTRIGQSTGTRPGSKPVEDTDEKTLVARLRKTREPIAVVGFKLPASLKDELSVVAQYNGTDMTRIVVEALRRLLPELPHPPNWKE